MKYLSQKKWLLLAENKAQESATSLSTHRNKRIPI